MPARELPADIPAAPREDEPAPADAPTPDPNVVEIPAASVQPCPTCGSLVLWWDARGGVHCMACERKGFERGLRLAQKARRLREQASPPAAEPAKPWPDSIRRRRWRLSGEAWSPWWASHHPKPVLRSAPVLA